MRMLSSGISSAGRHLPAPAQGYAPVAVYMIGS
jgi:hypothetical protein